METISQPASKRFSLKNKNEWSDSRFAWFYAILILVAVLLFAIILKIAGIYESMAWRVFNALFIIGGLIILVKDYKKHKSSKLTYLQAWLLCIRTGFYFALLFLPLLAFVVNGYPTEEAIINKDELYNSQFPVFEIVFANYVETIVTVVIGSILAAYFAVMGNEYKVKK